MIRPVSRISLVSPMFNLANFRGLIYPACHLHPAMPSPPRDVSTIPISGVRRYGPDGDSKQAEEKRGARLPAVPMGRRRPLPGYRADEATGGVVDTRQD